MDFFKDNIFYVILVAAVIVVSVPSYILGSQRRQKIRRVTQQTETKLRQHKTRAGLVDIVTAQALEAATEYKKGFVQQKQTIVELIRRSNRHLDEDFLVEPTEPGGTPDGEKYKQAYYKAYRRLQQRIEQAGLKTTQDSPLPPIDTWPTGKRPGDFGIRVTQKKYWIIKALVDVLTDEDAGVVSVQRVLLDNIPNVKGGFNRPTSNRQFWVYPMRIELNIDFRDFPVFLEKLINNEEILFEPPGVWKMTRAFDESKAVYIPQMTVSFDCNVWDYIETEFEKSNLFQYVKKQQQQPTGRRR